MLTVSVYKAMCDLVFHSPVGATLEVACVLIAGWEAGSKGVC